MQLFVPLPGAQCLWFNMELRESPALCAAYRFAGWLAGQMVPNRASLSIPLPDLVWEKVLLGIAFEVCLCVYYSCLCQQLAQPDQRATMIVASCAHVLRLFKHHQGSCCAETSGSIEAKCNG